MKRLTPPKPRGWLPAFHERQDVVDALKARADKAGLPLAAALRQVVTHYAEDPWELERMEGYSLDLDARMGRIPVELEVEEAITKAAKKAKISTGEAIRQILRRWLRAK